MSKQRVDFLNASDLLDYFTTIHSELDTRIKNHTQLLLHKVVTTGAIFSFIFSITLTKLPETEFEVKSLILLPLIGLWLVPAISILYDLMISKNISNIHKIGSFIKHKIEEEYFKGHNLWEAYIGQKEKYMDKKAFDDYIKKQNKENPNRRYKIKYNDWKEFRCYNKLDYKILGIYSSVVICLSFLGSFIIVNAFNISESIEFFRLDFTYKQVGLFISFFGLIFYVSWLAYFYLKFKRYILSFYDKGGIPYQINRKHEPKDNKSDSKRKNKKN